MKKGEILQEERNIIWEKWVNRSESATWTRKDQKGKKRYNESLKSSVASRTYLALNQRKRVCSSQKLKMTKATQSHRGIANVFGDFYSKLFAGGETEEELQNTFNHESRAVDEDKHNEEGINEELLLNSDSNQQAQERQGQRQQWNPSRRRQDLQIFNEVLKHESCTPENMALNTNKSYVLKWERRRCRKLSPDLYLASPAHTVFDYLEKQTLFIPDLKNSMRRSGRVPAYIPSARSLSDEQDDWTEMPRVGCQHVECDDWLHEGVRLH